MKCGERMVAAFRGEKVDRIPLIENSIWWNLTVERWQKEGLPLNFKYTYDWRQQIELEEFFGLDIVGQLWIKPYTPETPWGKYGEGFAKDIDDYRKSARPALFPSPEAVVDKDFISAMQKLRKEGKAATELIISGPFWEPREILGIEPHMLSFYDQPDLYKEIVKDMLNWQMKVFDYVFSQLGFDFVTIAEDLSYNNGPMIGKDVFDEFIAPYYKKVVPVLKERGCFVTVDSDGNIELPIAWFNGVGVEGYHPLEKQAGMNVAELQKKFPKTAFLGNYDKMVMHKGESAMRGEFERLLPCLKNGRYILSVDHQTPPAVSYSDYQIYLKLLREYAIKAF